MPYDYLDKASKQQVMTFLEWMLDTYTGISKQSTVFSYKRILFQVHHKSVGRDFDESANKEINHYINGYLTINYRLDTSEKEKPVMNVDDVYLVQHHHFVHDTSVFPDERQRLQLALLILMQSYTATRPRVLVYKHLSKAKIQDHYFIRKEDTIEAELATKWNPEEDDFKTLTSVGTQPQLQQVVNHRDTGTYQAYMNRRVQCDVRAAFLGRPSNTALMKAASHTSRFVDPRAPTTSSPEALEKLKTNPKLAGLVALRDTLRDEVKHESGTITMAKQDGTELYQLYIEVEI
ncbi:hypothetical protein QQZ08_004481 [Neonectria magnoliae]|uniref:Uncharacterized protein n=1 Tax=Neonectria magnoliae TaxID=2732573 RepID=A0ABR1I6X2_9HYPO